MQAMQTMAPRKSLDPPIELQLHLYDERVADDRGYEYVLSWRNNGLRIERGTNPAAVATVTADSTTWISALLEPRTSTNDTMTVDGDRTAVRRLIDEFRKPT